MNDRTSLESKGDWSSGQILPPCRRFTQLSLDPRFFLAEPVVMPALKVTIAPFLANGVRHKEDRLEGRVKIGRSQSADDLMSDNS